MWHLKNYTVLGILSICCLLIVISYAEEPSVFNKSDFLHIFSQKKHDMNHDMVLDVNTTIEERIQQKYTYADVSMKLFLKLNGILNSMKYAKEVLNEENRHFSKDSLAIITPALPDELFLYSPKDDREEAPKRLAIKEALHKRENEKRPVNILNAFLANASDFTYDFIKNNYTKSEIKKFIIPLLSCHYADCSSLIIKKLEEQKDEDKM